MKVLYASNICSEKEFQKIYNKCSSIKPLQSIQKFNKLLGKGLTKQKNVKLEIITSAPVNRKMCKQVFWWGHKEIEESIEYHYCFMINIPIIKFITLFFSALCISLKWCLKNKNEKDVCVIYDAYCPIIANVTAIMARIFNIKVIALYTDVPKCMDSNLKKTGKLKKFLKNIYQGIDKASNKIAKGYILLTEQMNEVVNKENKPYIVIEGLADCNIENNKEKKYDKFTILYAGGIYEKFGIKNLVQAVEKIDSRDINLLLYGNGDLERYLKDNYNNSDKIFYKGVASNDIIVKEEMKSTLLINPRFSNEEYTKYSFPSKNMEYMASGTPVLTTKLPGMPKEYYNYVYLIEDETVNGIKYEIEKLMKKPRNELEVKGKDAQKFVLENKSSEVQALKITEMIKNI